MRIIPAIDIIEGKAVRLSQGDYNQKKVYNEDPLEVAKTFEGEGLQYLHLVDLDGAKAGSIVNWKVLEKIAAKTGLTIDFVGGLKSDKDLHVAFESGADQITGGSIAVKNPDLFEQWISKYGTEKIILGADVKEDKIAVQGWTEVTEQPVSAFISGYLDKGIAYVVCTDIAKDGMLEGPSLELYQKILEENASVRLIASGGISEMSDLEKLQNLSMDGAIIGKAIYEGKISLKELYNFESAHA